jgi:hypothetical protein
MQLKKRIDELMDVAHGEIGHTPNKSRSLLITKNLLCGITTNYGLFLKQGDATTRGKSAGGIT